MTPFPSVLESVDDLSIEQIETLLTLAQHIERDNLHLATQNSLKAPTVYTLFFENSTRTKLSFATSAQKLGAHYLDFPIQTSSVKKGENIEETLLTLKAQGAELCVIRTSENEFFKNYKENPPLKLINGGDGINEHPTQALLDLYQLVKFFGDLKSLAGKTVGIAGDIIHSRVAHSLLKLLPKFGVKICLFGPVYFLPKELGRFQIANNKTEFLKQSDIIYLLRIQFERLNFAEQKITEIKNHYPSKFGFGLEDAKNNERFFLHPGPVNIGMEISPELLKSQYYLGHQQVESSIPVRMAILLLVLNNQDSRFNKKGTNAAAINYSIL